MFTTVNYKYADLFLKPHIDKQIKIIAVDFAAYGFPINVITASEKNEGKTYLNLNSETYYKCRKEGKVYSWKIVQSENELLTFKNKDIEWEDFEITESLCSETELRFGCCEASVFKFKIHNNFVPLKDKWLIVTETLENNTDISFQYGRYKVFSDVPTADRKYRNVTAYDAMYDIINSSAIEWYNTILPDIGSKVTMKQFRTSFVESFGLRQEDVILVNDDMIVEKTIQVGEGAEIDTDEEKVSILKESSLSGLSVINSICEINGCFGHIGREGKFHYIYLNQDIMGLYPSNTLLPDHAPDYLPQSETGHLYPQTPKSTKIGNGTYISGSTDYEDFVCRRINKVQIRQKENDIGAQYPEEKVDNQNAYIIEDNFLVYGKSEEDLSVIAKNVFDKVKDAVYRPFSCEAVGNPCLEVGDAIRLVTRYELIESYILKRTLKGIQGLRDSYSADGEEYRSEKVNSLSNSIIQLKGKTNILERNVEKNELKIEDVETGLSSRITQLVDSITLEVINGEGEDKKTASVILHIKDGETEYAVESDKINFKGLVSFENLENDGETIINGGNITTGEINCDLLNGGTINGQEIFGGNIEGTNIEGVTITGANITANEFTAIEKIRIQNYNNTGSVTLEVFTGGDTDILGINKQVIVDKTFTAGAITSYGNIRLRKTNGETGKIDTQRITAEYKDGSVHDVITVSDNLLTTEIGWNGSGNDNKSYNTVLNLRGKTVNAPNNGGITVTSDERLKNSFKPLDEFDSVYMDISPCAFKYNNGTSDRYHFGTTAQGVKKALEKNGYTTQDFAGFVQMQDNPENEDYCGADNPMGLIYTEFTMWNMHMIQKLYKKIEQQQAEIDSLKVSVSFLMERIDANYGSW